MSLIFNYAIFIATGVLVLTLIFLIYGYADVFCLYLASIL